MSSRTLILLVISLAVALGTAYIARQQLSGEPPAPTGPRVLVAAVDISQGSFVQSAKHLHFIDWPKDKPLTEELILEANTPATQFDGAVARRLIHVGEPITSSALVRSSEGGFMAAVLEPGMRAVSIAVDETSGNAGFIFPGDRVDLIVTHRTTPSSTGEGQSQPVLASETFIENVRVLAVDQKIENPDNTAILAKTVTLEVSKRQAEKINVAKDLGAISLSLRSLSAPPVMTNSEMETIFPEGMAEEEGITRDSDVSRLRPPHATDPIRIQVIRGDEREEVEFGN